jgi:DNA polymerase
MDDMHGRGALELLRFLLDAGADAVLDDEPHDRLAFRGRPAGRDFAMPKTGPAPAPPRLQGSGPQPHEDNVMAAREAAAAAETLDALQAIMEGFSGCPLRFTASRLVFGDGNPRARLMLVGEAPGREEDIEGRPFVGRSGKLLDLMLAAIGCDRSSAYIANIIPWRPPGNRTPTPQEAAVCLPFIRRQIALVDPDVLVMLGGPSSQALTGAKDGITKLRGRVASYDTGIRTIRALATFHPAYLLRSPISKRLAWRDFRAVAAMLTGTSARRDG